MDKQDKILKILQNAKEQADALTTTQVRELVDLLVKLTTKQKEELISKNEDFLATVSQETFTQLQDALLLIKEKANDNQLEVRQLTNKQRIAHEAKMSELEALITELKSIEIRDGLDGLPGQDADEEKIVQDVLAQIPQETGDSVIKKINKSDKKIKKERIEGLETFIDQKGLDRAVSILDQRTKFLINKTTSSSSGGGTWGSITGTLSDQTDLQNALNAKQATLVSGTNIKTINGTSLLGSGDVSISGVGTGTANTIAYWDTTTSIASLTTATYPSLTELSYVKGVTSSIQTQLGTKIANTGTANTVIYYDASGNKTNGTDFGWYGALKVITLGGTTAKTWSNHSATIEGGGASIFFGQSTDIWTSSNAYYNSGWLYRSTAPAANIGVYQNDVQLRAAPSGTADAALTWIMPIKATYNSGGVAALGGDISTTPGSVSGANLVVTGSTAAFASDVTVPDEAYSAGWNGSLEVPTKNAVYDKIETMGGGSGITRSISSISGNTSAGATATTDYVYICTATLTLTLPTAVGNTNLYTVKTTSGTTTVATTGGQTIDGGANDTITVANTSHAYISNGTNWLIV